MGESVTTVERNRLAIDGGPPVRSRPVVTTVPPTEADVAAAAAVLRSGRLGGPEHPETQQFEAELAAFGQVPHAVAVNSGTAAIHAVLAGLGVGPGDEVIVPAHTFIASATPILMLGAKPVVVDVDDSTYCIDPAAVTAEVTRRTKAIVAVHINGHPAPVDRLPSDIPVVSDACQAHGAVLGGVPVAALGAAAAFSFWQDKLMTTGGEGGALLTADPAIAEAAKLLRSHGLQQIPGSRDFHHPVLGYNYRLTGPQAAMGRSQLSRLPEMLAVRRRNAGKLIEALDGIAGITPPAVRPGAEHVFWKFVIAVDPEQFTVDVRGFMRALGAEGVPAAPRYPVALHKQPVLSSGRLAACPVAESLSSRLLTVALPATEQDDEVADVAEAVHKVATGLRR